MTIDHDLLKAHEVKTLMLSGGKDSLACFYLLKDYWDELLVMWVNTGDSYAETLKIIEDVKSKAPYFIEVKSDVKAFHKENGRPCDVVRATSTVFGKWIEPNDQVKTCSPYECCNANVWQPSQKAIQESGATLVIRGERKEEALKSAISSGYVENGVTYYLPIYDWTTEQLLKYLEEQIGELPTQFFFEESSLDCKSCTAFLGHTIDRKQWEAENYPEVLKDKQQFLKQAKASIEESLGQLDRWSA